MKIKLKRCSILPKKNVDLYLPHAVEFLLYVLRIGHTVSMEPQTIRSNSATCATLELMQIIRLRSDRSLHSFELVQLSDNLGMCASMKQTLGHSSWQSVFDPMRLERHQSLYRRWTVFEEFELLAGYSVQRLMVVHKEILD